MADEETPPPTEQAPPERPPAGPGRFVVPDPSHPPEGRETGFVPMAAPPIPGASSPGPPTSAYPPQPPPFRPPAGYPTSPPEPGAAGVPPSPGGSDDVAPTRRAPRAVTWVLVVVVALAAAVGSFLLVRALLGGASVEGGVDECMIEADGSLRASGWVSSDEPAELRVEVSFEDVDGGAVVDSDVQSLVLADGESVQWSASGSAGAEVDRVTCVLDARA